MGPPIWGNVATYGGGAFAEPPLFTQQEARSPSGLFAQAPVLTGHAPQTLLFQLVASPDAERA